MTVPDIQPILDRLPRYLRDFSRESHWEDIVQEGRLEVWICACRYPHLPPDQLRRVCLFAAYQKAKSYLRSSRNTLGWRTQRCKASGKEIPFSDCEPELYWRGTVPDFAPEVTARLWTEQVIAETARNERERWILERLILDGIPQSDLAEELGWIPPRLNRLFTTVMRRLGRPKRTVKIPYRGVKLQNGKISTQLRLDGKVTHLGYWDDPEEAAVIYDAAVVAYGLDRPLNLLPEECRR